MDISEVEENHFAASDAKLHSGMYRILSEMYCRVCDLFPVLESARPRSRSGIQALCSLHIALEKSKAILHHCSDSSKLYLAITGDSVVRKFEKAKSSLSDSLTLVEDIVPRATASRVLEMVSELEGVVFSVDPLEKKVGDEVVALLQHGGRFDSDNGDSNELESFHRAAVRLGITSSRAALVERRALRRIVERARLDGDTRKEAIVAYLLHLMRKYSKLFRADLSDDNDSQGSTPRSPSADDWDGPSKFASFDLKTGSIRRPGRGHPPEELRCPISLHLMYDPVIVSSGQTYERVCIDKWFSDGHRSCPKTGQALPHLGLTPNYSVKGLVANWCEQNGVSVPSGPPPESPGLDYRRLTPSESGRMEVWAENGSPRKGYGVPPEQAELNLLGGYEGLLAALNQTRDWRKRVEAAEEIRRLLKDDEEARVFLGANGFVEVLLRFLAAAVHGENGPAQEIAAIALFNLAVNNNRNKETMLAGGVIPLLEEMVGGPAESHRPATALYLNLSCLEKAKRSIGSSPVAIPFMVGLLRAGTEAQCRMDALHALCNVSTLPENIPALLRWGTVGGLCALLSAGQAWTERAVAVLANIAASEKGRAEIVSAEGIIGGLAAVVDGGEGAEQEQAVGCLLLLCGGGDDEGCVGMVLREGVVPGLVSMSVNGSVRGREKAQKLLMLFREKRQREPPSPSRPAAAAVAKEETAVKMTKKSLSKGRMGRALSSLWKR